jgi:ribosomal protein S18 acetylase RimI-like enzyme
VREDHRRKGVFRALYEHVHQQARAQLEPRVVGVRLYVEHENVRAQQTYASLGMRRTGYLVMEKCPL